jgi:putative nucleotidyltransferase with HDIG domain
MENQELQKRLSSIRNLPTLPTVAANVIELTQNPESTAFDIATAISHDQALASKVLRLANSAYYGFPRKISTINYAIVVLGLNNIKNIVLSTSVMERFSKTSDNRLLDRREFWKHSLLCGIIAKKIAEHMGIKTAEELFLSGLFHDFGKLILDQHFNAEFVKSLLLSKTQKISLMEAENRTFGFNHAGVGALVLKKWRLPISLVKAVERHHMPDDTQEGFRVAAIVHVADYLCRRIGIGSGGDTVLPELNKKAYKLVDLTSTQIKQMSAVITAEFKQATAFLDEGDTQ